MRPFRIVNVAEIADPKWTFLEQKISTRDTLWSFFSSTPKYWLERAVKRPNLARLRATLMAGFRARKTVAHLVISHLPRTTLWTAIFSALFQSRAKHLAFSFNFTNLPSGINQALMRYAFKTIDRFVVFSEAERHLYASYFSLDIERFDAIRWCMDKPKTVPLGTTLPRKYICAVGGEGRDYQSLLLAGRSLPHIPIVIVARPNSLAGLCPPANVFVFTNIKNEEFWGVVQQSSFVVLPLKNSATNCGHISIVGSHIFGKPIVSTHSLGTAEYLQHGYNALMSVAGDSTALSAHIEQLWNDDALLEKLSKNIAGDEQKYSVDNWVAYFDEYLQSIDRT